MATSLYVYRVNNYFLPKDLAKELKVNYVVGPEDDKPNFYGVPFDDAMKVLRREVVFTVDGKPVIGQFLTQIYSDGIDFFRPFLYGYAKEVEYDTFKGFEGFGSNRAFFLTDWRYLTHLHLQIDLALAISEIDRYEREKGIIDEEDTFAYRTNYETVYYEDAYSFLGYRSLLNIFGDILLEDEVLLFVFD